MPYLGNSGQFSNIYEKNHATSTLRIVEGSALYDPVGEDYTLSATFQEVTNIGPSTTNTVKFNNTTTSLTTLSRVGIANATPSYKLSVGGVVHMDDASSNVFIANGSAYIESNLVVGNSNLSVDTVNGYVGVNKIAPEYELDVVGDIRFTGDLYQGASEFVSSPWTSNVDTLYYSTSNVAIGNSYAGYEFHVEGNVYASQNITELSDARFKENVEPIGNALEKVCSIGGYTYNKIGDPRRNAGVLAQEVMTVLPEVVHGSEDTNYSVSYGNMVSLLIEAIKELKLEIDELKKSK